LEKPSPLSEDEWTVMRRHPVIGERILNEVPGFETVANAVRHEHERWDGTGYPDGLKAEEIPVASRIVLACDAYHAMTSERPYRDPLSEAQAREQLRTHSGTQFDPGVVEALLAALEARDGKPVMHRTGWRETIEEGVANNLRVLHGEESVGKAASL
jgi:HD-GYP domain-containing protein (c-di-GMP phosphodiesterase class II)